MLNYDMPLFRPPSEAYSCILQVTLGCSWNRCTFCEMYTSKSFRPRPFDDIEAEIKLVAAKTPSHAMPSKVFLADGNAFVLTSRRLLPILASIRENLPTVQRVSAYAMPQDILRKTDDELRILRDAGIGMLYIGVETGSDELLKRVDKGETQQSCIESVQRAEAAGIQTSVMILNGLGGRIYSSEHARENPHTLFRKLSLRSHQR